MRLSIIIVAWKVKDLISECLESIFQEKENLDFEVILVDNNSNDGTVEMVKSCFPEVKLITSPKNLGFTKGCNFGLKIAKGNYLLLLNPDVKIINLALEKMVDFMDKNPEAGIAGCKILNADGSIQHSVRRFPNLFVHLTMILKLHHFFSLKKYFAEDFDYLKTSPVDQVMGAFFMIRGSVYKKIGFLDEKYFLWFDEVDYCFRSKKAGYDTFYTPNAQVIHYGGQSFLQASSFKKQWYFSLSRLHYLKKHSNPLSYFLILILTPISLILTLISSVFVKNNVN